LIEKTKDTDTPDFSPERMQAIFQNPTKPWM
jgi:hypothetical protein